MYYKTSIKTAMKTHTYLTYWICYSKREYILDHLSAHALLTQTNGRWGPVDSLINLQPFLVC